MIVEVNGALIIPCDMIIIQQYNYIDSRSLIKIITGSFIALF